jgi:hypothetical protein
MRKSLVFMLLAVAALAAAAASPAIVGGGPDGTRHPEVGALLAPQPLPDGTWTVCSGTLVSPTVFLTAEHCDEGSPSVYVTFDSVYDAPGTTYRGTWIGDPDYRKAQSDPHDLAVVLLDSPVVGIEPAQLPGPNQLSSLRHGDAITSVGYGVQSVSKAHGPGGHAFGHLDVRYTAVGSVNSLTPTWLRNSQNASTGNGGTCYGDSGGPSFLGAGSGERSIIAAVTITGDSTCRSTNVDYRLDTLSARAFLGRFLSLPK